MENERNEPDVLINYLLSELKEAQESLKERPSAPVYESKEIGKIFEALSKAQGEMEVAKNDSSNPFFKSKYADLASIIKASRPYLCKHGLSIIQRILPAMGGNMALHTRIGHPSGQWMESKVLIDPPKKDIQSLGSYITYLRRYAYAALVGVVAGDEDDDGEEAMGWDRAQRSDNSVPSKKEISPPSDKPDKKISQTQLKILSEEVKDDDEMLEYILDTAAVDRLSDLPSSKYAGVVKWIRTQALKKEAK